MHQASPSIDNRRQNATDHDDGERMHELEIIDMLIETCKSRITSVADTILSVATKHATIGMYEQLREDAKHDDLRSERLAWMQENVTYLQEMIVQAALEREHFEADLAEAVEKQWIPKSDVAAWMATFNDPSLLEMYRSQWLKNEWEKKFKPGWKKLDHDRTLVLNKAKTAGVTARELPELATLERADLFLAKKFPERRSLVDEIDAKIEAVSNGKIVFLRQMEARLRPASTGADRYLHPAKVGAWLKKIAHDPVSYTEKTITSYLQDWQQARTQYDALKQEYDRYDHPDGCAPLPLNAFLAESYESRLIILNEWQNRLKAAKRLQQEECCALEHDIVTIRRAMDLKDYEHAERLLHALRATHPDDTDVQSITQHLTVLRERVATNDTDTEEDGVRTQEARKALQTMASGVPTVLTKYYAHLLQNGSADQAATFFRAMKARTDRRIAGATNDGDELAAMDLAEEADAAILIEDSEITDGGDAELIVTRDTPPSETLAMITARETKLSHRSPALIIEGLPYALQLQMVEINVKTLAHMRHLERVGKPYKANSSARSPALAA